MKKLSLLSLALVASVSGSVIADGHRVNGYVTGSAGSDWKTSYGECWRTAFQNSDQKKEGCGYKAMVMEKKVVMTEEVVATETAASVTATVNHLIAIEARVLFGFDSAELSADGKRIIMDRVKKYRGKVDAKVPVKVIGHTDATGSAEYNMGLSERRAASVADFIRQNTFLKENGIEPVGAGESQPVADNKTREGRHMNRRVDILFMGYQE